MVAFCFCVNTNIELLRGSDVYTVNTILSPPGLMEWPTIGPKPAIGKKSRNWISGILYSEPFLKYQIQIFLWEVDA